MREKVARYTRVLKEAESEKFWKAMQSRWDIGDDRYWYPLTQTNRPEEVIAFHRDLWKARDGDALLRRFLAEQNIEHCLLLREGPPDYEIPASKAPWHYDGLESFLTTLTTDFEWLLYVSHESSLTAAGTLAEFFLQAWPDAAEVTYGGPFHSDDLRGKRK